MAATPYTAAGRGQYMPKAKAAVSAPTITLPQAQEVTSQLVARVKGDSAGHTCLVSFSAGKESVGCWLVLRRHFERIVPFYLYLVPGLEFVENGLRMYEKYFGVPVIRLPHPSRYRWFQEQTFQPPERWYDIDRLSLPKVDYSTIEDGVREWAGDPTAYVAVGVRARDSLTRWASYKQHGAINRKRRAFYPLIEYTVGMLDDLLTQEACPLPVDYRMFGRSFDGIDYRFLGKIRTHYPADYRRILEEFPLVDLEIYRRERMEA